MKRTTSDTKDRMSYYMPVGALLVAAVSLMDSPSAILGTVAGALLGYLFGRSES